MIGRRSALLGLTAAWSLGRVSLALADAPTNRRLVVVILRGALDGMAAVVPYGDPALADWRPALIPGAVGSPGGMLDLGGFYGLHPALAGLQPLYAAGELLAIHAVAGHARTRSHFDAQDYLESGTDHRMTSGWLNRVAGVIPVRAAAGREEQTRALSVGLSMPLLLRGPSRVDSWAPGNGGRPSPDLYARIAALTSQDALIGPAVASGLRSRGELATILADIPPGSEAPGIKPDGFANLAFTCGRLLAAKDGPRLAALEVGGWDTHSAQAARLQQPLGELAAGLLAVKSGLGDAWAQTVMLVVTEFGRTVRTNGSGGTDHGTGTIAFVLGAPVAGGRVAGSWPGLAAGRLLDDRDLQPTTDLRSVAKGLLAGHFGMDRRAMQVVFPASDAAPPMPGLLRG